MATDWPFHYFVKANTVKLYMSDRETISTPTTIICQKRNINSLPKDSDSFLMLQIASGNCERDIKRLTQAVQRAISDIEQISTLKIDMKEQVNTMTDYLPKIDFLETNNRISAIHTKRDQKAVNATHIFPIKRPTDFIPLLQQEFSLEILTRILNVKPSSLVSTLYTLYTAQYLAAQTKTTFTIWLSKFLEINKLTAQILSPL
jgi:hypothetical protein